jgi:hypothetical protein
LNIENTKPSIPAHLYTPKIQPTKIQSIKFIESNSTKLRIPGFVDDLVAMGFNRTYVISTIQASGSTLLFRETLDILRKEISIERSKQGYGARKSTIWKSPVIVRIGEYNI